MAYKYKPQPKKTDQEWSKIRFQNSLGPQIGGLLHDAVALAVVELNKCKDIKEIQKIDVKNHIKNWLDALYDIAEAKKKELTEIKPVDKDKANEDWDGKKEQIYQEDSKLDDLNAEN